MPLKQNLDIYNKQYFDRPINENWYRSMDLLRPDELAALSYSFGRNPFNGQTFEDRTPQKVYSIGCGRGVLDRFLLDREVETIGVDPSAHVKKIYWGDKLIKRYKGGGDTIIFCESIEHIPMDELKDIFAKIPRGAFVIVVNWLDFHPIPQDGDDHLNRVDDDFFSQLLEGFELLISRGSHRVAVKI